MNTNNHPTNNPPSDSPIDDHYTRIEQAQEKYQKSEKGKAARDRWNKSEKGKESREKYLESEKGQEALLRYYLSEKAETNREKRNSLQKLFRKLSTWLDKNPGKTLEDFLEKGIEENGT